MTTRKEAAKCLDVRQRLDRLSVPVTETGCQLWLGSDHANGYGLFRVAGVLKLAHRAAWEEFKGPIPEGAHVLHKCDTILCINPNHLFIGSHSDNMKDMVKKGRNVHPDVRGSKNGMAKLTEADIVAILLDGRTQRTIATEYGVTQATVSRVKTKTCWSHHEANQI